MGEHFCDQVWTRHVLLEGLSDRLSDWEEREEQMSVHWYNLDSPQIAG